jgi:hypothetical protein
MRFAACLLLVSAALPAAENVVWRLGVPDVSSHEFGPAPGAGTRLPVVVQAAQADAAKAWPAYQPGTANARAGGKPYPFTLVFPLAAAPRGTFTLDLYLLFRQPRVPALDVEVNGRTGRFYFDPELGRELGGGLDEFNPIHSVAHRRLELPASLFQQGENRLTLTAVDEPAVLSRGVAVAGDGDSGLSYDALALLNDPAAAPAAASFAFEPTIFFVNGPAGLQEECRLTARFPAGTEAGQLRVRAGDFSTTVAVAAAPFGEARYTLMLPDRPGARTAEIEFRGAHASLAFTAARKWKLHYTPHEHVDIGFTDYRAKVAEVFSQNTDRLLDTLDADPSYRHNFDGSWMLEGWLATRTPSQATRFAAHARAGRIGVNAWYAGFVTGYPSFEGLTRALYPSYALSQSLGTPFDFALVTDIPSNSWSVPSVLASAGVRYFADGGNQDRGPLLVHGQWNAQSPFWWEGPDGQRVLAFYSRHYHQLKAVFGLPPDVEAGRQALPRFLQTYTRPDYKPDSILLYGTDVENVPLDFSDGAFVKDWNRRFAFPEIITCRFGDYFRYVEERYGKDLPVVRGGSGDYWADNEGTIPEATARDRGNQGRVLAAEALAAVNAGLDPHLRFPLETVHAIWREMLTFFEHSDSSSRNTSQPDHDEAVQQLAEKADQSVRAANQIDRFLRVSMSQLANRIPTAGRALLVYNPLSWTRSALVRYQLDRGLALEDPATGRPVEYEVLDDKGSYRTIRFMASGVPSLGYKVYALTRGAAAPAAPRAGEGAVLENEFYRVTLDPEQGAIRSIVDKKLARELVDPASPYRFNQYVIVTSSTQQTRLSQPWNYLPPAELTVNHTGGGRLLSIAKTPWGMVARMESTAPHTPAIHTEIRLPAGVRRIEVDNRVDTEMLYTTKMAGYFAFPWAAARPVFRYDGANGWVNPERDLMEGAGSEWLNVQHTVAVEGSGAVMSVATRQAPLMSLGDINRGRWPSRFSPASGTVFSYVLNNIWSAKWGGAKAGSLEYDYAFTSDPAFDAASAARFGREQRNPLEAAEIKTTDKLAGQPGPLPAGTGSLATVAPDTLAISALKGAEDGDGLVIRVAELAGKETDGTLTLPWAAVGSARSANSVEAAREPLAHDAHTVHFHVKPFEVVTLRVGAAGR